MKAKKVLGALALVAGVLGLVVVFYPDAKREDVDNIKAEEAKKIEQVAVVATDTRYILSQDNTSINWTATKNVMGKLVNLGGGWNQTGKISGEALVAADGAVRQISATIEVATVWTESDILTDIMRKPETGFFAVDKHPRATFLSSEIKLGAPEGAKMTNATHTVKGNFQLNGIEKSITIPAVIKAGADGLEMRMKFGLNRSDYNCHLVNSPAGVLLGDKDIFDDLAMSVKVKTVPAKPAVKPETGGATQPTAPVDVSKLAKTFNQTVEVFQVSFDMVLVPGDEAKGIKPLYFGKKEVTWDEFLPWVYTRDILPDEEKAAELRALKKRPSLPYGDVTRGYGNQGFPALSMSRISAELYCAWLSEQTGKKYRLPTEKEWEHLCQLSRGGKTGEVDEAEARKVAIYDDTSWNDDDSDWRPRPGASAAADALGLHDVIGNFAEWVTDSGEERVVRGGHYKSPRAELGPAGRLVEDQDVWNMNYPNVPKSIWWFVDATWVGFRLVCEP